MEEFEQSKALVSNEVVKGKDLFWCSKKTWQVWLNVCRRINASFEKWFRSLGTFVAHHPTSTVCVSIVLSLLLATGFFRFFTISRVEELYIPQSSVSLKDINRAEQYFRLKLKAEEFILLKRYNESMIDDEIFEEALKIHEDVARITGLDEICIKHPVRGHCNYLSPLEIFQQNATKLHNTIETLNTIYLNSSYLLNNGRPASFSYRDFFGYFQFSETSKRIVRADALRALYLVEYPEDNEMQDKQMEWEDKFIRYMSKKRTELKKKGLTLLFSAGKSLDGSVSDSAATDIRLIPISFILMFVFCALTLAKFRNHVVGHFCLGIGGICVLGIGITAGFGFGMLIGAPYVAFAGVLPFLILGVGIDNIFIIADCLDRQHPDLKGPERISKAFGHVGASITMTTLTDLVAFGVSMVTDFPVIKYFCLYAALCITFCYLLVITAFLALMTYDVRRIDAGKSDFIPCVKRKKNDTGVDHWKESHQNIASQIMSKYALVLMKTPVKYITLLLSFVLVIIGVIGATRIDQSFDMLDLGLKGSDYLLFYEYRNEAYPSGFDISVIVDTPMDYSNAEVQRRYAALDDIPKNNKYMEDKTLNWMTSFLKWCAAKNMSSTGHSFSPSLRQFLLTNRIFLADLRYTFVKGRIFVLASRVIMFNKESDSSIFRKDTMLTLRHDLKTKSKLQAYPINLMFIYIEQFVIIFRDTIRNLTICAAAILLITLPYLVHPVISFFVFYGFVSLIFELLGLMYFWNVSLNSISMIVIVMAIGFVVDYSAHVAHAFMISKAETPEKRVIDALRTMGSSVLMGGASTFVGVIVTAFASSEIFKIFFKMVFGIVVLGLIHGLIFLPVHLSIFCRTDLRIADSEVNVIEQENGEAILKKEVLEIQANGGDV